MFNLMSGSNIILTSEGYENRSGCLNGIDSVRENSQIDIMFEKYTSSRKLHYFVLRGIQGRGIGTSEEYYSGISMNLGIEAVKKVAPTAAIEDMAI